MRSIKLHGEMAQGKSTLIDNEDFEKVNKYKWYFDGRYAIRYLDARVGSSIRLHRFIMNAKKGQLIDHINRDKLDNQKKNLRFCTRSENRLNQAPKIIDFTKYKICRAQVIKLFRICIKEIQKRQKYYNGQKGLFAHVECVIK